VVPAFAAMRESALIATVWVEVGVGIWADRAVSAALASVARSTSDASTEVIGVVCDPDAAARRSRTLNTEIEV
jgi:hypothetical protein